MYTWISKSGVFAAAVVSVAACDLVDTQSADTIEKVRLANGVLVEGSPGWCVAPEMLRATDDASVVVFGSCAAIASVECNHIE